MTSPTRTAERPLLVGGALAVLSALLFGLSTPFVQRFGQHAGSFATAGLLYIGAAAASLALSRSRAVEAPVRRSDLPRLLSVALCGAVAAPVCLAWGLHRTGATTASLMLSSEAFFTVVLARAIFHEPIGLRVAVAMSAMGLGAAVLLSAAGSFGDAAGWGPLAVLLASLAWAADNTLTRPLADLDPGQVVVRKSAAGAVLALAVAWCFHEPMPSVSDALGLACTGAVGYGTSLYLYLGAQRRIGAGRTGSIFATAPFLGALAAWAMGDRSAGLSTIVAGLLFGVGVALHLTEQHGHAHRHAALEHEHRHRHDDGHHTHVHDPPVLGEHSHAHVHTPLRHVHPHGPDLHHQHEH